MEIPNETGSDNSKKSAVTIAGVAWLACKVRGVLPGLTINCYVLQQSP